MYRGRFAPSPTGPLHFGSLVAAAASFLDARAHDGEWLVRMEDLDTPRVVPGAADGILECLERMCFTWNTPVMVQSERNHVYAQVFSHLRDRDLVYPCGCSRKEIEVGESGCTCAKGLSPGKSTRAWQVRGGDFVLLRADGIFAYQLAVVVDDAAQGITDVVRGADLLDSTPRQNYLQGLLGYAVPRYKHVPVVLAPDGQKLSKQTGAAALDPAKSGELLWDAFVFLGLKPPAELRGAPPTELWPWAIPAWYELFR